MGFLDRSLTLALPVHTPPRCQQLTPHSPLIPSLLSYLPTTTWQLELFLALFSTVLLFLQLTSRLPPLSQIHFIPYLTIPLSLILFLDSYLTLTQLESLYSTSSPSPHPTGYTLNERRFREQRDCYLALYTLVIGLVINMTEGMVNEVSRLKTEVYRLKTRLDRVGGNKTE